MRKDIYSAVYPTIIWASFCTAIIADPSPPISHSSFSSLFSQPRIGLGFAVEYINYEISLKLEPRSGNLGSVQTYQSQIGRKFLVAPSIEFGATFANDYYMGFLVSWHYAGVKDTSMASFRRQDYLTNESQLNQYIDVLLKPGYKITPRFILYGLVGPSLASWSHTTNQLNGRNNLINRLKIEKKSIGLGFGLGIEYHFKEKYAISADYTHHLHKPFSESKIFSTDIGAGAIRTGTLLKTVKPSYGTIAVRFTTYFSL